MIFRNATGAEMMVAHCVWGNYMWTGIKGVKIVNDYLRRAHVDTLVTDWGYSLPDAEVRESCSFVCDTRSPVAFIFCPEGAGVAQFVHEVGHAVCDRLFPASRDWGTEQLEAFALLADVNAGRWRTLEPSERAAFNSHVRACRKAPGYERALKWAFSLRKLPLKEQMEEIARG